MNRRQFVRDASLFVASTSSLRYAKNSLGVDCSRNLDDGISLADDFFQPGDSYFPWVYSFWLSGNVTREGITADLEAMHQTGIRGLLFMDGEVGGPSGSNRFMSDSWLALFDHMMFEASRLGIEVNLNNAPGWAGSGGPWITPEKASQKIIASQTIVSGPASFEKTLQMPEGINHNHYQDVAVIAYALAGGHMPTYKIPAFDSTKSFAGNRDFAGVVPWPRFIPTDPHWPEVLADEKVLSGTVVNLTSQMQPGGKLAWEVPEGQWLVLRIGHTVANGGTRSAQPEASGLECDKLSKSATEWHFTHMVSRLVQRSPGLLGKTIVSTHIDSWEAGSGNWTDGLQDEFKRLRGYDLLPYLATLQGFVVDSREISERFLWDFRETICQLFLENYVEHFKVLAGQLKMRLSIEGYDGICDDLRYAGRADEPMTEFWIGCYNGLPLSDLSEGMASAAHVYGRQIVGAEAFTSFRGDFTDHPATLKPLADWAFCTGVNRLCFSEWIIQPWPRLIPGMSFASFGTVFHETLTWWRQAGPWHEYIARCQMMLRQGTFVADICFITPEGGPYRFTPPIPATTRGVIPDRPGYNFDGCPAELVLNGMSVIDGTIALPSGMRYKLLVLPTYDADSKPVIRLNGYR